MYNATNLEDLFQNYERRYTVILYYLTLRLYYMAISPTVVVQYVSAYLGRVIDMCVGHCRSRQRNVTLFDANGPPDSASDYDATSAN